MFLENSLRKITKNKENLIVFFIIKTLILYTTQFTRHKPDQPINSTHANAVTLARDYDNFSVFLSSYRNTIIDQSARVFSVSYFLKDIGVIGCSIQEGFFIISVFYLSSIFVLQHVQRFLLFLHEGPCEYNESE